MYLIQPTVTTLLALILMLVSSITFAGPGHDHSEVTTQASASALPRFIAISEELEMVGVINGKQLTLYLDRFADNSPINDARIEIDIAGSKYTANKHGEGEYEVTLKDTLKPSVIPVTATINAGELTDLLAGELDLHEEKLSLGNRLGWKSLAIWIVAVLLALIALGATYRFRQHARRA